MAVKPTDQLNWVTSNDPLKVVEPIVAKKDTGYLPDERPPAEFFNWNFNVTDRWIKYLTAVTDIFAGRYDAVVATSGGTHTTLAAAITASSPGWNILILNDEVLASTVQITNNNISIEAKHGITLSDGGANTGIEVSADNVKISSIRFAGFSVVAVEIDNSSNFTRVQDCNFSANTSEIDNQGTKTNLVNLIEE